MWIFAESITVDGWQTAFQFLDKWGFNAGLVILLLHFGRQELREIRKAMDRQTRMVTVALLELSMLQPGVRKQLESLRSEIDAAKGGIAE